jgi:hypothetical protein
LQVEEVNGTEVICSAGADAVLDGLLMVFHIERSNGEHLPTVPVLPVLLGSACAAGQCL